MNSVLPPNQKVGCGSVLDSHVAKLSVLVAIERACREAVSLSKRDKPNPICLESFISDYDKTFFEKMSNMLNSHPSSNVTRPLDRVQRMEILQD